MTSNLERSIGLGAIIAICISSMLGSGIFVLPGIIIDTTGPSAWLAYFLAALCIFPAVLSKSELATAMPTSGGTYVYLERTFGPMFGAIAGLGIWLSLLLKSSFALVGFAAYLQILTDVDIQKVSLSILGLIVVINILGVSKVSGFIIVVVITSLSILGITGIGALFTADYSLLSTNFVSSGFSGLIDATGIAFISYIGVTKVAAIAEEIKEPQKNLPKGIMISLAIVTTFYCGICFLLVVNFPVSELSSDLTLIYLLGKKVGGYFFSIVIVAIAILTMSSMANSGVLAASRFPFAMSRDKLMPSFLGKLNNRYLTPTFSIIISGLVIAFTVTSLDVVRIVKLASAFILIIYMLENVAVVVLRESRIQWYQPEYKAPFYPMVQILGIISNVILMIGMGSIVIMAILVISIPGIILYFFYIKNRVDRKGVLGIRGKRTDLVENYRYFSSKHGQNLFSDMEDAKVVVCLFGREHSPEMLVEIGIAIAEHGNIEVARITEVPEQIDLHALDETAAIRSLRRRIVAMGMEKKESISFDPVITRDLAKTIYEISRQLHCQWILIEWGGKTSDVFTFHNPIRWFRGHLHCNFAIFKDAGVRYIRRIMVLLNKTDSHPLILRTATIMAEANKADITFFKFLHESSSSEDISIEQEKLESMVNIKGPPIYCRIITGEKRLQTVLPYTAEFDLLIFGCMQSNSIRDLFGSTDDQLISKADCSVVAIEDLSK